MKNRCFVSTLFVVIFFYNTAIGQESVQDLSLLNGKWELPCEVPFENPENMLCPFEISYEMIKYDPSTGKGEELIEDYQKINFNIFKKDDKWMITWLLSEGGEKDLTGEIVKLDDKEFKVKVEERKIYYLSKRASK